MMSKTYEERYPKSNLTSTQDSHLEVAMSRLRWAYDHIEDVMEYDDGVSLALDSIQHHVALLEERIQNVLNKRRQGWDI